MTITEELTRLEPSYASPSGSSRFYDLDAGERARLVYVTPEKTLCLTKYDQAAFDRQLSTPANAYLGACPETLRRHGEDVLGQWVLAKGEPDLAAVEGLLPPIRRGGYGFAASQGSWSGVMVDQTGALMPQCPRYAESQVRLFSPLQADARLGAIPPVLTWLNGDIPAVLSVHRGEDATLELLYAVEAGDPGRDPDVWVRARLVPKDERQPRWERFLIVGRSGDALVAPAQPEAFYAVLEGVVAYWTAFHQATSPLTLPEKALSRALRGALACAAATFSDAHPHYGHLRYGWEVHDHFPPTVLTAIEAYLLLGQTQLAGRVADYMLRVMVEACGRFCYRQGGARLSGASATEYGQLLWLLERYEARLKPYCSIRAFLPKLEKVGALLMEARRPDELYPDLRLIRMCAEADTNGRIYSYLQNAFWAARGLQALARLTGSGLYAAEAESLLRDAGEAVARSRVSSRFGPLPPFRVGYTATPSTLSDCRDTYAPVTEESWYRYLSVSDTLCRDKVADEQDYAENTYANYRYYPEMLSARCLKAEEEDTIVRLREALGGELLGMTRFLERVDDWPVYNYARFLLETDRIDKYLLLLYAHTRYHGLPDMGIYFEQFGVDGSVFAPDCVPSVLITPLMTAWALAFEPVKENALYLLRAAPKRWFQEGFKAERLGTRFGDVSLAVQPAEDGCAVMVTLPPCPADLPVYLDLRLTPSVSACELADPQAAVLAISGHRLRLRPNAGAFRLVFKRERRG